MQIVQAVFGVFHHFELAHQLYRRHHLRRIYSTWPWARLKREGLPRELVATFPYVHTPDYFLLRSRYYPTKLAERVKLWNSLTFDAYTARVVPPCDAFIGISGTGLKTGPVVQRRGGKFVCDRGSTHHRFQEEVLAEEYRRRGVAYQGEAPGVITRDEAIYELADAITVPSSVARRSFAAMGVPADKVHVIPYGVRLERFQPTGTPPDDSFEVLFAGGVGLRKGIPYMLEAFARLRHPRKRLTVAGAVQHHMAGVLARLPQDHVQILGAIPQAELIDRMSRSHVLMLCSVEEGLALVQAQAMACGCPVLATEATGAEDLFTNGVEGFIVPDRDVDALASRLEQLADQPELRARMSAAGLERVRELGGWERYGDRWEQLLRKLTGAPAESGTGAAASNVD